MPYLGKFLSVSLQSLSFLSAIALLMTADAEIQISRSNRSMYITAFSDIVSYVVEKMQLIEYLLHLLQLLQYLFFTMVDFCVRRPTNLKRTIFVVSSIIKECNSDEILYYQSATILRSCPSFSQDRVNFVTVPVRGCGAWIHVVVSRLFILYHAHHHWETWLPVEEKGNVMWNHHHFCSFFYLGSKTEYRAVG